MAEGGGRDGEKGCNVVTVFRNLRELEQWILRTHWMTDSTSCKSLMLTWRESETRSV